MNHDFHFLSPLERRCLLVAGMAAGTAALAAALMLFDDDGRTPWFAPGSPMASAAEHCERPSAPEARHACLRRIAAASAADAVALAGR